MDSNHLLQYLIPVIFLVIWMIGKIFGGKKGEAEEPQSKEADNERVKSRKQPRDSFEDTYYYPIDETGESIETIETIPTTEIRQIPEQSRFTEHKASIDKQQQQHRDLRTLRTAVAGYDSGSSKSLSTEQAELRTLLKNSNSVRRAVLISEILGNPIALRQNGKMGPRWKC